ncbi:MAG TPA: hypothetical protein VJ842_13085 [Pyrinomonadaceae bacterium]|nr:hypothetical protein [Pyrinomonadaceae bacterium]
MEPNRRFTILTFPQSYDGTELSLNVVILPRNQNPLLPAIEQHGASIPPIPDATPFADAKLILEARIIIGLNNFPNSLAATDSEVLQTDAPANARDLFLALAENFKIKHLNPNNADLTANDDKADATKPVERTVKKYLPLSYRQAFNFTTPRTRNAVTDDSYRCAVRDAGLVAGFERSPDEISWGKVFAFALRQPLLARQLGMIYQTKITIKDTYFPQGGWLYVDLAVGSDYREQLDADPNFIQRYAARIPTLTPDTPPRQVFAPLLFPVRLKAKKTDPDPDPDGTYDELFIEAAAYDDGFAKIVHARQPFSRDLLAEEHDGAHPVKDAGIRLGWDDEQILIWYMRQMMVDDSVSDASKRLDAPLGVFGYAIDVRETADPENAWDSLNAVQSKATLTLTGQGGQDIPVGDFDDELPYQVYPAQLDGNKNNNYWLPMYFAGWNGHSMVLPDNDAAAVYQTTNPTLKPDTPNTGVTEAAKNRLNELYTPALINAELRYGRQYDFRVRLRDLSGGGARVGVNPVHQTSSNIAKCHFKRYVAPNQLRIRELPFNTDDATAIPELNIQRPLIGYPAVVFTGKYADPVSLLSAAAVASARKQAFGIADPDVDRVEITVEVQTLKMDNLLSVSGKDNYVHLYTTHRSFDPINDNEDNYEATLNIPIVYKDCPVLHTGDEANLNDDLDLGGTNIDDFTEIIIPTARTVRLTIRGVCENKEENESYYGLLNDADHERDTRFGHTLQVMLYQTSEDERTLFFDMPGVPRLEGIFLQPDPPFVPDGSAVSLIVGKEVEKAPDMIQRLARQLGIESTGLTLTAPKGERIQFGCSSRIRHTLAPENSSLTFSSKGDLMNHWLCCVNIQINRDWTWDAVEDRAFVVNREMRFTHDDEAAETERAEVGDVEIKRTASFESLHNPQRNFTRLIFIDAVEPKNERRQDPPDQSKLRFPDTIEVKYSIETHFKTDHGAQNDGNEDLEVRLPITTNPTQIPKIASAGIALSPYTRNDKYSATEPRRRFLWIEFAEPVDDPNDTYFARVLAYAPDQLISNNHPDLFVAPREPSIPLDPEYIRVILPGASNDLAGLKAMQPMQKATDSDKHYLLPLPPGLHADAAEMFGFFTYEFRVGHYRERETEEMVWSTAQGRFGRPLRATGVQHPAPTLLCSVNRDEDTLNVSAPYAMAVFGGKNVTADPPRTQLWCLLYAQVRQADNRDFRNILLDDKQLDWRVQIERDRDVDWLRDYDVVQRDILKRINIRNWKDELDYANSKHVLKLADNSKLVKSATKYGTVVWSNKEIIQMLQLYGLPLDSPLSVLVVEILPTITNFNQHIPGFGQKEMLELINSLRHAGSGVKLPGQTVLLKEGSLRSDVAAASVQQGPSPVSDALGHHRILRTSPLTEVPFVCCTDC